VQLRHVTTETSWDDVVEHGYIKLFAGDKELAKRDGFQHNRKLRAGGAWDNTAVQTLVEEATKAMAESVKVPEDELLSATLASAASA